MDTMTRCLAVAALLAPAVALAQDVAPMPLPTVTYQKVTEITFDTRDLHALPERPDGVVVIEHKPEVFRSFIRVRSDFDDEMRASVDEVK